MNKKNTLFLAATHGDEGFSIPVLKSIEPLIAKSNSDWDIANPLALSCSKRFIDADLNRVAPGERVSEKYEYSRAYGLINKFKNYKYIIDIHGTPANTGIFVIVTNPKIENLILAASLPIQNVVIWASRNLRQSGPLTQFAECGLEIECGQKNLARTKEELYKILCNILLNNYCFDRKKLQSKKFFRVYDFWKETKDPEIDELLNEFEEIDINGEKFYPMLINRYPNVVCYKLEEINFWIDYLINNYLGLRKLLNKF